MSSRGKCTLRLEPLGLSRVTAATYIGVSPTKFDELVKDGRMPCARMIDGRRVWCRDELEDAFDALPRAIGRRGIDDPWLTELVA